MQTGDYREIVKNGKTLKVVTSKKSGDEYAVLGALGKGGVGKTYKAGRLSDKKIVALKIFEKSNNTVTDKEHQNIRRNVKKLIDLKNQGKAGKLFETMAEPYEIFDLPVSNGFAYAMELIDFEKLGMLKLSVLLRRNYPDSRIILKICLNMAKQFRHLHRSLGLCYKDVNLGNIFVNPDTGDIKIIDLDNISIPDTSTVIGTYGFIAPEVYETEKPDNYSDYYAEAALFFYLLTGKCYPLQGKMAMQYAIDNNVSLDDYEVQKVVYGKNALFIFDPKDTRNSVRNLDDFKGKVKLWDDLPEGIHDGLMKTFVEGLKDKYKRTSDSRWIEILEEAEKNDLVECPSCGKYYFGSRSKQNECAFCGGKLKKLPPLQPKTTTTQMQPSQNGAEQVSVEILRNIKPERQQVVLKKNMSELNNIHPGAPGKLLQIKINTKAHKMGVQNCSAVRWSIKHKDGTKEYLEPGKTAVLEEGMKIVILYRKLQLNIMKISI